MAITINHPLNSKELELLRGTQDTLDSLDLHTADGHPNTRSTLFLLMGA